MSDPRHLERDRRARRRRKAGRSPAHRAADATAPHVDSDQYTDDKYADDHRGETRSVICLLPLARRLGTVDTIGVAEELEAFPAVDKPAPTRPAASDRRR